MAKKARLFGTGVPIAAALAGLTPAAAAEPAEGQAGATSRATLTIAVSVAPRAGVRGAPGHLDARPGQWCAWSTSALRGLSIEFQSTAGHLAPAPPIRVEAGRSPAHCAANDALQLRIADLSAQSPAGAALLLVAPE